MEYTGKKITHKEHLRLLIGQALEGKDSRTYMVKLNRRWRVDGSVGGSGAEFINHSCDPNLTIQITKGRIFLRSRKRIRRGQELTADYGFRCSCPCRCGARNCRGVMCQV